MDEAFLFLPRKCLDVPQSTILFFGRDHCFGSAYMGSVRIWIRPFLIWLGEVFGCAISIFQPALGNAVLRKKCCELVCVHYMTLCYII